MTEIDATKELASRLRAVVGVEHVRDEHTTDATGRATRHLVAAPGSAAEVAELVRLAASENIGVVPVGTRMREDLVDPEAERRRILLDLRRLQHILRLDEESLVVHVQAGLTAIELEEILDKRGLSLGDYPPSTLNSTIGGLLAVRTPGKLSRRHGFIEDAVLGLSAVLADGRTIHTRVAPRRASGPDLARAICGSEGTLGIITSAVLRIHRRPESRFLAAFSLPSFEDAISTVYLSLREEAAPAAMRAYDSRAAHLHFGDLAGDSGALLLVATAGPTDLAACDRDLVASAARACDGEPATNEIAESWWRTRIGKSPSPVNPHVQVSATAGNQKAVYRAVREAIGDTRVCGYASRFDLDGGVLFFTLLDDDGSPLAGAELAGASERALAAARDAGAYLLGKDVGSMEHYFHSLRSTLDPDSVLNPGALPGLPDE